jgi:hypothetical protein
MESQALVAHTCNPRYSEGRDQEMEVRGQLGQIVHNTLSQKYPTHKRTGKVAQVVECLSSKYKFPSSNFGTTSPPKKEVFYFYIVVYLVYYNVCQRTFGFNFYF